MYNVVKLDCGHELIHRQLPNLGSVIYCLKCNTGRKVSDYPDCYFSRCRSCRYAKNYGADLVQARRGAIRHGNKTGHVVAVQRSGQDVYVCEALETLPFCDPIPF